MCNSTLGQVKVRRKFCQQFFNRGRESIIVTQSQDSSGQASNTEAYDFLRSLYEFSKIPTTEIRALAYSARIANLDPGQYITIEGEDESSHGFIVVSGHVAMVKTSISGKELIVELLQPGDIFGMLLMLAADRLPSQLSARAINRSTVIWLPIKSFTHMLDSHLELFKGFVAQLLLSLQSAHNLSRGLAHDRVEVRIASVLASLALKYSKKTPTLGATINLTRQQIADLTGTTPETAIRVTRAMQLDGLIDIKRPGIIRILDLSALEAIVDT